MDNTVSSLSRVDLGVDGRMYTVHVGLIVLTFTKLKDTLNGDDGNSCPASSSVEL